MIYTFPVITPGHRKRYTKSVESVLPLQAPLKTEPMSGSMKGGEIVKRKKSVLVCVTGQKGSERLILQGKREAEELGASLKVLCVQPIPSVQTEEEQQIFAQISRELEYLRQKSKDAGAEMTVYFYDDPALAAAGFAKEVGAIRVVTGVSETPVGGFVDIFHQLLPKLTISLVSRDGVVYHLCPPEHTLPAARVLQYGLGI